MIELKRGATSVALDDLGQGLQIVRISKGEMAFEFAPAAFFLLEFRAAGGGGFFSATPVEPGSHPAQVTDETEGRVVIHWAIRHYLIDALQLVTVTIWIDDTETVNLHINVRNRLLNFSLLRVQFPTLRIKTVGEPGNNILTFPFMQGGVLRDPAHQIKLGNTTGGIVPDPVGNPNVADFPYPSISATMQFWAYYLLSGELLYLQTTDGTGFRKDFTVGGFDSSTEIAHHGWPVNNARPGNDPDAEAVYDMPYVFQMAVIRGNWYDAARRYREWALKQVWAKRGPIANAPDFSPRMRNAVASIGQGAANPLGSSAPGGGYYDLNLYTDEGIGLAKLLGTSAIELGWFYWHEHSFGCCWPEWDLRPTFSEALERAHAAGLGVVPYVLTNGWDTKERFYWEHDGPVRALKNELGANIIPPPDLFASISPVPESTRQIIVREVSPIVTRLGTDGLYLDAWSGGAITLDHNPELRRAGGTSDHVQGKRAQTQLFKETIKRWNGTEYEDPDKYLVSEFVDETLIDSIELVSSAPFLFSPYFGFRPMPLYSTVYHDYQMSNELIAPVEMNDEVLLAAYLARLALIFHSGRIASFGSTGRASDGRVAPLVEQTPFHEFWDFVKALTGRHSDVQRYQRLGERLRPLSGTLDDLLDKQDGIPDPSVQGSVWRSGEDIGVLLSNTAAEPRVFTIRMSAPDFPISGRVGLVEAAAGGSRKLLGLFDGAIEHEVTIEPLSLLMLEIFPEAKAIELTGLPQDVIVIVENLVIAAKAGAGTVHTFSRPVDRSRQGTAFFQILVSGLSDPSTDLRITLLQLNDQSNWVITASLSPVGNGVNAFTVPGIGAAFIRLQISLTAVAVDDDATVTASVSWS